MKRRRKLPRDACFSLSIVAVARAGLLAARERTAGMVPSLRGAARSGPQIAFWVPVSGEIGPASGVLTLYEGGRAFPVRVEGRPSPTPHRVLWSFLCPTCGARRRVLLRPEAFELGWGWSCGACLDVTHHTGRDGAKRRRKAHRAALLALRDQIDWMLALPDAWGEGGDADGPG